MEKSDDLASSVALILKVFLPDLNVPLCLQILAEVGLKKREY